jgi:hypothetical protein
MSKRIFIFSADGEVLCTDPSCSVSQCGQCSLEHNKRQRAVSKRTNQIAAEKRKREESDKLIEETAQQKAEGRNTILSEHSIVLSTILVVLATALDSSLVTLNLQLFWTLSLTSDDDRNGESKKAKPDKDNHTTWNHLTRCMFTLYGRGRKCVQSSLYNCRRKDEESWKLAAHQKFARDRLRRSAETWSA